MTYLEQIEQYVGYYPETAVASVPVTCGVTELPSHPSVNVHVGEQDYCELEDGTGREIARFRLVG
jgi:hypothetical protein